MSHTKGKWVLDESRHDGSINVLDPFRHIAMVSQYRAKVGDQAENEANAELIAKAPDMHAALQRIAFRCQTFLADERTMQLESIEAILSICDSALD